MKDKSVQVALSILIVCIGATFVLLIRLFAAIRKLLDRPH